MNQPVNTILSNQQLQVALHNYDLLERLRALRGSGGGSGGTPFTPSSQYQAVLDYANAQVAGGDSDYAPPSTVEAKIVEDNFIRSLVSSGEWGRADIAYNFATTGGRKFSLINLKNPGTFNATVTGTPTFIPGVGWKGNGVDGLIDTNWVASTNGVNYTLNSAHFIYRTPSSKRGLAAFAINSTSNTVGIGARGTSGNLQYRINSGTTTTIAGNRFASGRYILNRNGTAVSCNRNAVSLSSITQSSTAVPTDSIKLFRTGASTYTNEVISFFAAGASIHDIVAPVDAAIDSYFTAIKTLFTPVYIYNWMGQSNMERRYPIGNIPGYLAGDIAGVKVWTGTTNATSDWLTLNQNASGMPGESPGPILEFGYRLKEKYPSRDIRIVHQTEGGSRLYDDIGSAPGSWYPTIPGSVSVLRLYDGWVEKYNWATEILPNYIVQGMCWGQGESDATSVLWATAYQANEVLLKADIDLVLGGAKPFVAMNVRSAIGGIYTETATVRSAKATNLSNGTLTGLIETNGYTTIADNLHYDMVSSNAMAVSFVSYF